MKIVFDGGPKDGQVQEIPAGMPLYRVPVIAEDLSIRDYEIGGSPSMRIADYRFTRRAYVNLQGEVEAVVYEFAGMED